MTDSFAAPSNGPADGAAPSFCGVPATRYYPDYRRNPEHRRAAGKLIALLLCKAAFEEGTRRDRHSHLFSLVYPNIDSGGIEFPDNVQRALEAMGVSLNMRGGVFTSDISRGLRDAVERQTAAYFKAITGLSAHEDLFLISPGRCYRIRHIREAELREGSILLRPDIKEALKANGTYGKSEWPSVWPRECEWLVPASAFPTKNTLAELYKAAKAHLP
jgi:hypothetical protein